MRAKQRDANDAWRMVILQARRDARNVKRDLEEWFAAVARATNCSFRLALGAAAWTLKTAAHALERGRDWFYADVDAQKPPKLTENP